MKPGTSIAMFGVGFVSRTVFDDICNERSKILQPIRTANPKDITWDQFSVLVFQTAARYKSSSILCRLTTSYKCVEEELQHLEKNMRKCQK